MSSEPPSGLSSILEISLMDQSDHKIINGSHHFADIANRHTPGIFLERHIIAMISHHYLQHLGFQTGIRVTSRKK